MTCWIAETDYPALARVALGPECCPEPDETTLAAPALAAARDAVAGAAHVLQGITGQRIHGPGIAVDEILTHGYVRRSKLIHQPVRKIIQIERITECESTVIDGTSCTWMLHNGSIYFTADRRGTYRDWEYRYGFPCRNREGGLLKVEYLFGSTLTLAGRNAALSLARQLYLAGPCGDPDQCQLPERVTSVTREGLSFTMLDPQNFYEKGRIGVPVVDQWLTSLKLIGNRASGVWTPDAPPAVNVSVSCRPVATP